jgi:hypothetical protein
VYVLIHSPSVGPATWAGVAGRLAARGVDVRVPDLTGVGRAAAPYWPAVVDAVRASLADADASRPVVLVGHSNAGLFLPVIGASLARPIARRVFVDALLPEAAGSAPLAEPEFLEFLRPRADADGVLPRWTDWFDDADVGELFPDADTQRVVLAEQPRLPLAYYQTAVPLPAGWTDEPGAYVLFSGPYEEHAERARDRGWPVHHLPGGHLHQLVAPDAVADLLTSA